MRVQSECLRLDLNNVINAPSRDLGAHHLGGIEFPMGFCNRRELVNVREWGEGRCRPEAGGGRHGQWGAPLSW